MRKILALLGFLAAMPMAVASAADLPVKAPPPPPASPLYNWSGPFIGIVGGGGSGKSNQTDPGLGLVAAGVADGSFSVDGGFVGGMLGYNWQSGPWVYGLEGSYSWANIGGSSNACGPPALVHSCGTTLENLGTFVGRFGYAFGPTGNWLPFVAGGLAVGDVNAWDSLTNQSGRDYRAGWTVGGGVEVGITRNWAFTVEYLYVDLGKQQMFNVLPNVPETVSFTANIILAGITYSF